MMQDRKPTVDINETLIVIIVLAAVGAYLLWAFFNAWGPALRRLA